MEKQIAAGLKQLNERVKKIEDLTAWCELEQEERKGSPETSFQMHSTLEEDLKQEIGAYFSLLFDIMDAVKARGGAAAPKQQRRLQAINKRFMQINLAKVFYP